MRGVETEWRKTWWRHRGWETSFAGPGGNSANPEARRSFLRGSWRLCTPSLLLEGEGGACKVTVYFQSDTLTLGITRLDSNTPILNKVVDELLVQVHAQNISIRGLELSLA